MENEPVDLKNVKDLQEFHFRIPFYQRGYRWKEQQVKDLLNDIDSFQSNEKPDDFYFLQALVVRKDNGVFRVVDGQQRLTTLWLILKYLEGPSLQIDYERGEAPEKGLDFSYMDQASKCIEAFFDEKDKEYKEAFCNTVLKHCSFLFYEIPAKDEKEERRTFRELNSGKISATDSDLAKYLLLKPDSDEGAAVTRARAEEWDAIDRKLNDEAFFSFMTPRNTWREEDRMTVLFRYAGFSASSETEAGFPFPFFQEIETKIKNGTPRADVWGKISEAFHRLEQWFHDPLLYHAFGWYVHRKNGGGPAPEKLNEKNLMKALKDAANYQPNGGGDDYDQGGDKLHHYLLLHNVAFCWQNSKSYDFRRHREVGVWSLEHIFARNQRDLPEEDLNKLLPGKWEEYQKECAKGVGNEWLSKQLGEEKYPQKEDNSIRNLALLPGNTNSAFSNRLFEGKQNLVDTLARNGWKWEGETYWVPPVTEAIFRKAPELVPERELPYWSEEDKEKYFDHMQSSIRLFVMAVERDLAGETPRVPFPRARYWASGDKMGMGYSEDPVLPPAETANADLPEALFTLLDRSLYGAPDVDPAHPGDLFSLLIRYRIEIPCIQRHYVQGADTPQAKDVRTNFIKTLKEAEACGDNTPVQLHFIYGPVKNRVYGPVKDGVFTPVDGQQRLTTLWLLARYAAERFPAEKRSAALQQLSRFSYVERLYANQFCRALTSAGWQAGENPAESIPAQPWFQKEWRLDTTVASMLRMLSTIHEIFGEVDPGVMWDFLQTQVKFHLLTENFPDDIYLKLNARGLQLTQWERFKGEFAGLLSGDSSENSVCMEWNEQIEKLSNRYFTLVNKLLEKNKRLEKNKLPDDAFFALAARLAVAQAKIKNENCECGAQIKELANFADWKTELPFVPFQEFKDILPQEQEQADRDKFAIHYLCLVDRILKMEGAAQLPSPYWQEDRNLFQTVFLPQNENERELSLLLFLYFAKNDAPALADFSKALRCMWNILENVKFDEKNPYARIVRFREQFIDRCVPSLYDIPKTVETESVTQWDEEWAKAAVYAGKVKEVSVDLLQKAECNLHGRVRLGIFDLKTKKVEFRKNRLEALNALFDKWNPDDDNNKEASRKNIVLELVAAHPYDLLEEPITLSTGDDNLLALLTNRNDKALQTPLFNVLKSAANSNDPTNFLLKNYSFANPPPDLPHLRDWRKSILMLAEKKGDGELSIWERKLTSYSTKEYPNINYYLIRKDKTSVMRALPVGDWRIDLIVKGENDATYQKLKECTQEACVDSESCQFAKWDFLPDRDVTNSVWLCRDSIILYLWPDRISVRAAVDHADHVYLWEGEQLSEKVWQKIKKTIQACSSVAEANKNCNTLKERQRELLDDIRRRLNKKP